MKKFLIIFSIIISILVAISFFINSTYFFNKYIATTIKDYGFNYKKVDGALLSGFKIDKLSYKNEQLASKAELEFSPIKLLEKKISIKKLRLIDVNKDVLDTITKDFKPKEDSSSSTEIGLNFEIKDIVLTVKPFSIQDVAISKNILNVEYIEYINNKFNIGKVDYSSNTSLGDVKFSGRYEHRVFNIDNLELKSFNLKKFLPILKTMQSKDSNSSNSEGNTTSPIIPKEINVKYAKLALSPFKLKDLSAKDLKVEILNGNFNVEKLNLNKAEVNFKYRSNLAKVVSNVKLNKNELNITKVNIDILNASKLEKIYKKYTNNSTAKDSNKSSTPNIITLNKVYLNKLNLKLKNYKLNKEKINSAELSINKVVVDLNSSKLKIANYSSKVHTATSFINISGSVGKKIIIDNAIIKSSNLDKLTSLFSNKKSADSNRTDTANIIDIPNKYILKNVKINGERLSFNPFVINKATIVGKNISGDINTSVVKSGNLKIDVLSNWGKANLDGKIKNSNYFAKGSYKVDKVLLNRYNIPLVDKNIDALDVDGRFGIKDLDINIKLSGKNILNNAKNIDIIASNNKLIYKYKSGYLELNTKANINTDYTGLANLENKLIYAENLKFSGKLTPKNKLSFAKDLGDLFNNLSLTYSGDSNKIDLAFKTDQLKGQLKSNKYSSGILTVENTKAIKLGAFTKLPKGYSNALISKLHLQAPINFKNILPLKGTLKANSNLVNLDGTWSYDKNFSTKLKTTISKKSLIAKNLANVKLSALSPMNLELYSKSNTIESKIKSKLLSGVMSYNLNTKYLKSSLNTGSLKLNAKGSIENINLELNAKSIKRAIKEISRVYTIKNMPNVDGNIALKGTISKIKGIKLSAKSSKIIYKDKKKSTKVENIVLNITYNNNNINISSYKFKTSGYDFYSNRASSLALNNSVVNIKKLWLNDSLLITGNYNTKASRGSLKLKANNLKINQPEAKVTLAVDTNIKLNKEKTSISGKIVILDGVIKKSVGNKKVSENSDIIILQRKAAKENTNFAKNVKLNIKIKTNKAIIYAQNGSYFKLKPNLNISKNYRALLRIKGLVNIQKGGYYILNGKKIVLQKGKVVFKGQSTNPNINIVMLYHGKEYDIRINLSGTPDRPVLYFTSNPPLTKEQILAYLLFDDSTAAGTHSQEAMLSLIGGTIAKSFLGSIGIKIDHISIKENGFSIGKSITNNVTIYYNQDGEKASIKTRVDITKSIHTEVEVGEKSQSADIIFSKEY